MDATQGRTPCAGVYTFASFDAGNLARHWFFGLGVGGADDEALDRVLSTAGRMWISEEPHGPQRH